MSVWLTLDRCARAAAAVLIFVKYGHCDSGSDTIPSMLDESVPEHVSMWPCSFSTVT
jgi:hypothetical protein